MSKRKVKIYLIKLLCANCGTFLYRYRKEGGGALVKCYVDGILEDDTNRDLKCPKCQQLFARIAKYRNRPAHKIIHGKVIVRGHYGG